MFAAGPRQILGEDPMLGTLNAPAGVVEEDLQAPQRDEAKPPHGKLVIAGTRFSAFCATGFGSLARTHDDIQSFFLRRIPMDFVVNEALERVGPVQ
jgi:hypothetical protein